MNNQLRKHTKIKNLVEMLTKSKLAHESILAWRIVGKEKVVAEVNIIIIRKYRSEFVFKCIGESSRKLELILSGADQVNFFSPSNGILFQTNVKSYDEDKKLVVQYPSEYVQLERRKYLRYQIKNENVECFINVNDSGRKIKKNIFDISAGGISFIVTREEAKFFSPGVKVDELVFKVENDYFQLKTKVVSLNFVEPNESNKLLYPGWKVGISFIENSDDLIKRVNGFVFSKIESPEFGT